MLTHSKFINNSIGGVRYFHISRILQNERKLDHNASNDLDKSLLKLANKSSKLSSQRKRSEALLNLKGQTTVKSFDTIVKESQERYHQHFTRPSKKWASYRHCKALRNPSEGSLSDPGKPSMEFIKSSLEKVNTSISPMSLFEPLNIGDAVELTSSLNQSVLGVIVEVPYRDDDPRYAIMNRLGELLYVERSAIKFRIPGVIPKEWLSRIVHEVLEPPLGYGSIKTTATHFRTFAVNPAARNMIVEPLLQITNRAWSQIQETSRKLEIIHRLVQVDGPREISIFSLMKGIQLIDIQPLKSQFKSNQIDKSYSKLLSLLTKNTDNDVSETFQPLKFGKNYGSISEDEQFDAALFYSVVLALRKQTRLWSNSYSSRSTLVPLSITVLPLEYSSNVDYVIEMIKTQPQLTRKFQESIRSSESIKQLKGDTYDAIFYLLREYAVGNLNEPISTSLVARLMKDYSDEDITRSMVYKFLIHTGHIEKNLRNPTHFTTSLNLPNNGIFKKASNEQAYFDNFNVEDIKNNDIAFKRVDYTKLRVYCIDSPTAHEIDDGVSISKIDEDNVMLYIHIADPTSYLSPNSTLCKIAFERSFTTYQPEVVAPMLPKSISDLAGLGVDGKLTRALTFSVPFNKKTNEFDLTNSKVEATSLSNFPKYTYDDVDRVLGNVKNQSDLSKEEHQDLKDLHEVSLKLRDSRIKRGAVIFGESFNPQLRVSLSNMDSDGSNDAIEIIEDSEVKMDKQVITDSVILVSELMILGNSIAGHILKGNKERFVGVYKGMNELPLLGTAATVVQRLNETSLKDGVLPNVSQLVKAFKFIVPAYYSHVPKNHSMLGVSSYAPSTSPLRRFGDLVNHFQLHSILNEGEPSFTKDQLLSIALHIEGRNDVLKKASRSSVSYYATKILEKYLEEKKPISSELLISSRPLNGWTSGILLQYGIYATVQLQPNRKPPAIGDVIRNYEIVSTDSVGGKVMLKELPKKKNKRS